MNRVTELRHLDGLPIKDAARMPHPTLLRQWDDAGLYFIDASVGVFRLTDFGWFEANNVYEAQRVDFAEGLS